MPKDSIDMICETFMELASQKERDFWKPDILHSVASVLYYRFEELLDCYPDRPDIMTALVTRVREIVSQCIDMRSSYKLRMQLSHDMREAYLSLSAIIRVGMITKACVGYTELIAQDINLKFLDLKPHSESTKKLAKICLSHFEARIAEQLAERQTAEAEPAYFSPEHLGV